MNREADSATKDPVTVVSRRRYPWNESGTEGRLFAFAMQAMGLLAPKVSDPGRLVAKSGASEPHAFEESRERYGTEHAGFERVARTEYYEGGGWEGERSSVSIVSFGLTPSSFELHLSGLSIRFEARGPSIALGLLAEEFDRQFDETAGPAALDALSQGLRPALARQQWNVALQDARAVLVHRPDDVDAWLAVGISSGAQGDLDTAEPALRRLLELNPLQVDGLYGLGLARLERGDSREAAECFERVLAIDSANHPAHFQLGQALSLIPGRGEEALAAYRQAVATSPNPGGQWGYRGLDFTAKAVSAMERMPVQGVKTGQPGDTAATPEQETGKPSA